MSRDRTTDTIQSSQSITRNISGRLRDCTNSFFTGHDCMLDGRIQSAKYCSLSGFAGHISVSTLYAQNIADVHEEEPCFGREAGVGSVANINEIIKDFLVLMEETIANIAEEG